MNHIYGMQRANGDWFVIKHYGEFRVPVFSNDSDAKRARSYNVEMLVFQPVLLDERALKDLVPVEGQRPTHFWLVDLTSTSLKRGVSLNHQELVLLVRGTTQPALDQRFEN